MTPTFPPTGSAFSLLLVLPASQAKHWPPFYYVHPGPHGGHGQYHPAGVGMNTPQAYYDTPPPHLPFSQHSNAGSWGYGHYLYTPGAGPFLHPGEIQPINNATNQMQAHTKVVQTQVHVDVGQLQASNQPAPTKF
ncbi:hypothetical protein V8E53_004161 [Lactarius tabidus]